MNELAVVVRKLRNGHGWTQEDLAERVGMSQRWVSNVENGAIPRMPRLRKLADALGVDRGVLIAAADLTRRADVAAKLASVPDDDPVAELHRRIDPYLREVADSPALASRLVKSIKHTAETLRLISQPLPTVTDDRDGDESPPAPAESPVARQDQ